MQEYRALKCDMRLAGIEYGPHRVVAANKSNGVTSIHGSHELELVRWRRSLEGDEAGKLKTNS